MPDVQSQGRLSGRSYVIYIDFETYSECDLKKCGSWAYSQHPSTEILCMAYAIDNGPVQLWTPGKTGPHLTPQLKFHTIEAHNAFFERSIWENICVKKFGWPMIRPEQWRCSAAKAAARALPRALGNLAEAMRVSHQKDSAGKALMLKLCKPQRMGVKEELKKYHDPIDLYKLYDYCKKDVEAERAVSLVVPDLSPAEQEIWFLDQKINHRGIAVDIDACRSAIKIIEQEEEKLTREFLKLVEGRVTTATQRDKLLAWFKDSGVDMLGLTKADVVKALGQTDLSPEVRRVLELRQQLSKTSTAKFQAMLNSVGDDGRIRDTLMYHGAATGRWTGKLVQMQNIPRGTVEVTEKTVGLLKTGNAGLVEKQYPDVMAFVSSHIRAMLIAAPGKKLVGGDYASIEARVLFWLAGEERGLGLYRKKADLYVEMARRLYGKDDIEKTERMVGKTTVLGCGYGMGAVKFRATLEAQTGIKVSEERAQGIINTYRTTFPAVSAFWWATEAAALAAMRAPGKGVPCGKVFWGYNQARDVLFCQLPSRRLLSYNSPRLKPSTKFEGKLELSCMVSSQGVWTREATYGGKLVENVTQAVARDIMAAAMLNVERAGWPVVLSVHDELVVEVEETADPEKFRSLMCYLPAWADGCPIEAEAWEGRRYKK